MSGIRRIVLFTLIVLHFKTSFLYSVLLIVWILPSSSTALFRSMSQIVDHSQPSGSSISSRAVTASPFFKANKILRLHGNYVSQYTRCFNWSQYNFFCFSWLNTTYHISPRNRRRAPGSRWYSCFTLIAIFKEGRVAGINIIQHTVVQIKITQLLSL